MKVVEKEGDGTISFSKFFQSFNMEEVQKKLELVNTILSLNVDWKDDYFISDSDINGIKERDTLNYWVKIKHDLSELLKLREPYHV